MTRITAAERVFLARAEAVTESKRTRVRHYEQQLRVLMAELQPRDPSKLSDISKVSRQLLKILTQLEKTEAEQAAHAQKVNALRAKQQADQVVIRLCADANKLAGTDGANFFTKACKVFQNEQETPDESKDDSPRK